MDGNNWDQAVVYTCSIEDERLGLPAATAASMISHVSIMKVAEREAEG